MSVMEVRKKSQITIPKDVVEKLSLHEGDKLEIAEKGGIIYMLLVSVYPKKYIEELEKIASRAGSVIFIDNVQFLIEEQAIALRMGCIIISWI